MTSKEPQMRKVRQDRFPISLFFVLFGVLLLMSGIHYGFTILVSEMNYPTLLQIAIIWLCILLAIPGFIGWILPHFLYKKLSAKKAEIAPLIEEKFDEIYQLCERGTALQK